MDWYDHWWTVDKDDAFFPAPLGDNIDNDLIDETRKWVHIMPVTDIVKYSAHKYSSGRDILTSYNQHTRAFRQVHLHLSPTAN